MSNSDRSHIRKALLDELRRIAFIQNDLNRNQQLAVQDLAKQLTQHHPSWPKSDVWQAIYELFYEGVLVPVGHKVFANPFMSGNGLWDSNNFSITDSGMRFLESTKDQPDPYDAETILKPLRARGIANETVEAYIPEAVNALTGRAYRGVFVLLGVAAEALSEDIYDTFERHLSDSQRTKFRAALNAKKTSAEGRWNAFISRFPHDHDTCLGDELTRRFANILEPQLKFFKHNRDDAAHRRATLISQETAQSALSMFVPFGITVADVIDALKKPCLAEASAVVE